MQQENRVRALPEPLRRRCEKRLRAKHHLPHRPEKSRHPDGHEKIRDECPRQRERRKQAERVAGDRHREDREGARNGRRVCPPTARHDDLREHHSHRELREPRGEEQAGEPRIAAARQREADSARHHRDHERRNQEVRGPQLSQRAEEIRVRDVQLQDQPDEPPRRRDVEERPRECANAGEAQHRAQPRKAVDVPGHEERAREHDEVHRDVEGEESK